MFSVEVTYLSEVKLAVPERAARKFARLCRPQPWHARQRGLHSARHRHPSVDVQLRDVLASVAEAAQSINDDDDVCNCTKGPRLGI
jgi:hypothetical protein